MFASFAVAAKMRYEELKKQTQAELKATLDDLLEGEDKVMLRNFLFVLILLNANS